MTSKTFFTSDHHFGHNNIIKFENRPFEDVDHMNEMLIENWNEVVPYDGKVYVLGDFIMGKHSQNLSIIKRLNGQKYLIAGNHDKCWGGHKNYGKYKTRYIEAGISWIADRSFINLYGASCVLSHFPKRQTASKYDERFINHHETTKNVVIHGHVHSSWKIDEENQQINVGVDAWNYKPVALEEISEWIQKWK